MSFIKDLEQAKRDYTDGRITVKDLDTLRARHGLATASEEGLLAPEAEYLRVAPHMADQAVAQLTLKGFPVEMERSTFTIIQQNGQYIAIPQATYIRFTTEAVAFQVAGGVVAPVAPDGTELVARCDRGASRATDGWSLLRPSHSLLASTEQLSTLAKDSKCYVCERADDRRHLYLVRKSDASLATLGSTCGTKVFGVALADLWPAKEIERKASEEIEAAVAVIQDLQKAEEDRKLSTKNRDDLDQLLLDGGVAGGYDRALEVFEAIHAREGLANGYVTNTAITLKDNPGRFLFRYLRMNPPGWGVRLSRWGESIIKTVKWETDRKRQAEAATTRKRPTVAEGSKATFEGKVTRIQMKVGRYGPERCVFLEDATGWRFWFRSSDHTAQEGAQVSVTGAVTGYGDGITFLGRVKVEKKGASA